MSAPAVNRPGTGVFSATRARIADRTLRTDRWWLSPLRVNVFLSAWVLYATIRAFWGSDYWVDKYHYLTPFYSPCISASCVEGSSHLGFGCRSSLGGFRWVRWSCRFCWRSG